jgi:iron complex transport system permease protein
VTLTAPQPVRPDVATVRRPAGLRALWLVVAALALALAVLASVAFGTRVVSLGEVMDGLGGDIDSIATAAVASRVPRTVLAVLVGAMLAVSGASMQAVTRNPLADPGILGVSFGAALAVVFGIAVFGISTPNAFIAVAILGAGLTAVFVYVIGSLGYGGMTPLKLALAGAATAAAFTSLISAILLPRVDIMTTFRFWQIGGVGGATWDRVLLVIPFAIVGLLIALAMTRGMNTLALGDDVAAGLGENVARARLVGWGGAVLLCGAATAVAGPIAFVGLVIPHVARLLFGSDYRWIIPASVVLGAALLVAADTVGRVVARPQEIEVGIITALIGAPFFLWIVRRQKVREL